MASIIDLEDGLGRLQGSKALYKRMLNLFLQSKEPAQFEQALADNDLEQASAAMHSIKGVAGNLGLTALFESSSVLMTQLKEGVANSDLIDGYRAILKDTQEAAKDLIAQFA